MARFGAFWVLFLQTAVTKNRTNCCALQLPDPFSSGSGLCPLPFGDGSGKKAQPPSTEFFFDFRVENDAFWCILGEWVAYYYYYYYYSRFMSVWILSGTTRVSHYKKGKTKTNVDFLEQETVSGSGISWVICNVYSL